MRAIREKKNAFVKIFIPAPTPTSLAVIYSIMRAFYCSLSFLFYFLKMFYYYWFILLRYISEIQKNNITFIYITLLLW